MVCSVVIARVGQSPLASKEGQAKCENYLPEILYNTAGPGYLTGEHYCLVDFRKMKSAGKHILKIVPANSTGCTLSQFPHYSEQVCVEQP